jgi:nitroreductase
MKYPNETLKVLMERRSLRAYRDEQITTADRQAITDAVLRAPTAGNMMLYSVIDITDQKKKETLAELCDHQPMIARAPMVWLFLADYQKWDDYFQSSGAVGHGESLGHSYRPPGTGDLFISLSDALIAAQTAVTAAESLHIGSCYIGDILENYEQVRDLLELPRYVFPITMVCFGYPKGPWKETIGSTPRHRADDIFHTDGYARKDAEQLQQMFAAHDAYYRQTGRVHDEIRDTAHAFYMRKHTSEFMAEMNRSVSLMLENWS